MTQSVLWMCLGLLCSGLGYGISSVELWCFMGLFWAVSRINYERGAVDGVTAVIDMEPERRAELESHFRKIREEEQDEPKSK